MRAGTGTECPPEKSWRNIYLHAHRGRPDLLVLALPRGGVPVGYEVAEALGAELDILVVRKLGLPRQPELAMGAIASGGISLRNPRVIGASEVSEAIFNQVEWQERRELRRREEAYRGDLPQPVIEDRCVILVDDGLAAGSTMLAAAEAVRAQDAAEIVVAVPVAPHDTIDRLLPLADEVICPATLREFYSIGEYCEDFSQVDDEQVRDWLRGARKRPEPAGRWKHWRHSNSGFCIGWVGQTLM